MRPDAKEIPVLNGPERNVLHHLDLEGMIHFISDLVKIPSLGGAETEAQLFVADWMRQQGREWFDVCPVLH